MNNDVNNGYLAISHISKTFGDIQEYIVRMEKELRELEAANDDLHNENEKLDEENQQLHNENKKLRETAFWTKADDLHCADILKCENKRLRKKLDKLEADHKELIAEMKRDMIRRLEDTPAEKFKQTIIDAVSDYFLDDEE